MNINFWVYGIEAPANYLRGISPPCGILQGSPSYLAVDLS